MEAATYVEQDCTIEHDGRTFEAGGAVVTDQYLIAYLGDDGSVFDWHGQELGTYRIIASWPVESWMGRTMHQVEATVGGIVYTGRSFGSGMLYRGRRKARQPR